MSNKIALDALTDAKRAINSMKVEAETAGAGGDQEMLQDACEQISNEGLAADTAIRAAIAALEAMEAGGWLPISEAPKGRKVLAGYKNKLGNWRTVTACYYLPQTLLLEDDRDDLDDDGYAPEGWYEESETQEAILRIEESPTHFQPLPTPPKD